MYKYISRRYICQESAFSHSFLLKWSLSDLRVSPIPIHFLFYNNGKNPSKNWYAKFWMMVWLESNIHLPSEPIVTNLFVRTNASAVHFVTALVFKSSKSLVYTSYLSFNMIFLLTSFNDIQKNSLNSSCVNEGFHNSYLQKKVWGAIWKSFCSLMNFVNKNFVVVCGLYDYPETDLVYADKQPEIKATNQKWKNLAFSMNFLTMHKPYNGTNFLFPYLFAS